MKLRAAFVMICTLLLGSCSRPYFTWIVNNTGERLVIVRASPGANASLNVADGSRWWPGRSNPVLGYYGAHQLTSYGSDDRWELVFELGSRCTMTFSTPSTPPEAIERPDWQIYLAYGEVVFQLGSDLRLYRTPAHSTSGPANVTMLPQPEGYPLAPSASDC